VGQSEKFEPTRETCVLVMDTFKSISTTLIIFLLLTSIIILSPLYPEMMCWRSSKNPPRHFQAVTALWMRRSTF